MVHLTGNAAALNRFDTSAIKPAGDSCAPFEGWEQLYADTLPYGLFLLGRHKQILFANAGARDILTAADALVVDAAALAAIRKSDDLRLQLAIDSAIETSRHFPSGAAEGSAEIVLALMRRDSLRPYTVVIAPAPTSPFGDGAVGPDVIIRVGNPDAAFSFSADQLHDAYGMTVREAEIATLVASGLTASDCAAQLGISPRTVQNNLQRVYQKTGARRQGELVKLLLTSGLRPQGWHCP